jgi:peptide/nickel transport system substrate-binding protein
VGGLTARRDAYLSALKTPPFAWDVNLGSWQATIDSHWMYQVWTEDGIPDLNVGAYRNPAVEALFLEGSRAFDRDARRQIYQEIQRLLAEDQAAIFISQDKAYTAVNKRIGGIRPSPLGLTWNIHEWYVK